MIHLELEQGDVDWHRVRSGVPTASRFSSIVSPHTLKPSKRAQTYLLELLANRITGIFEDVIDDEKHIWMARGKDMEAEAADWYAMQYDASVQCAGFCLTDDGTVGCSPDRFVGDDGLLEVKCPKLSTHLAYFLSRDKSGTGLPNLVHHYRSQVQGQLWVTGRAWCDLLSYPGRNEVPPVRVRVEPDPKWVAAFSGQVVPFVAGLAHFVGAMEAQGVEMLGRNMPAIVQAVGNDPAAIIEAAREMSPEQESA